ncbi:MAG: hypothetical protein A2381_10800 [Bdellovibrionales bacterium RIFOXYB1_FULL_37_110]|nr:MAG: hypothetical protein A2417_17785 [Bdellovibrionales bacterium RIFOXYC1_FULL_37_79]OFZ61259.1 MAG: hypothetical protein A2381_10800 [Bdellovibrionales bacterium RIFOXYB1_FULL_37_110]OFZ62122.1 MAG: hypothetical protein A2577_14375 [Bdellovibrionales bacterium RIFOXYD1_FULL_36_51]
MYPLWILIIIFILTSVGLGQEDSESVMPLESTDIKTVEESAKPSPESTDIKTVEESAKPSPESTDIKTVEESAKPSLESTETKITEESSKTVDSLETKTVEETTKTTEVFVPFTDPASEPTPVAQNLEKSKAKEFGIKERTLPILENITTNIENPVDLRDPFKMPDIEESKKKNLIQNRPYWVEDGVITNIGGDVDPSTVNIENMQITGILLGPERRATVKIGDNRIVLKEGMLFGPQKDIELKAIMPAGVVFVEKIKNVYNQDEYIETIIPVRENPSK